jgi:hypothetical protein
MPPCQASGIASRQVVTNGQARDGHFPARLLTQDLHVDSKSSCWIRSARWLRHAYSGSERWSGFGATQNPERATSVPLHRHQQISPSGFPVWPKRKRTRFAPLTRWQSVDAPPSTFSEFWLAPGPMPRALPYNRQIPANQWYHPTGRFQRIVQARPDCGRLVTLAGIWTFAANTRRLAGRLAQPAWILASNSTLPSSGPGCPLFPDLHQTPTE